MKMELEIAKTLFALVFCFCFIGHVWEQVTKFFDGRTMTVEEVFSQQTLRFPAMTLCAEKAYKKPGFFFNETSFDNNAYTFGEIFHHTTKTFFRQKGVRIKEVISQFWGRCFTLSSDHEFAAQEYLTLSFALDAPPVYVLFHQPGEEFFIIADAFPWRVASETVKEAADCKISKYVDFFVNDPRNEKICRSWEPPSQFYACSEERLARAIKERGFNCTLHWWKKYFPSGLPECQLPQDFNEIERFSLWVNDPQGFPLRFGTNPEAYGCPKPCRRERYKTSCQEYDPDFEFEVLLDNHEERFGTEVWFYYQRTEEEHEKEIFLFSFSGIVAGVGGSLGLFLGFSCLQGAFTILDALYVWMGRK